VALLAFWTANSRDCVMMLWDRWGGEEGNTISAIKQNIYGVPLRRRRRKRRRRRRRRR